MAYERLNEQPLDYKFCRYGASKLLFRGPKKNLKQRYNVFIGATETFGKFVDEPFPELIEGLTGIQSVNFGIVNAGVDVFVKEKPVLDVCEKAKTTVIQVMGAQNMSNRFYSVHPRRNDRFLQASELLKTIYREVDFTEFSFTRHMLKTLETVSPERFALVQDELQAAWQARMGQLLTAIPGRKVLLKMSDRREAGDNIWADPMFISNDMTNALRGRVADVVDIDITDDVFPRDAKGMQFPSLEAAVAAGLPGPDFHMHVATRLRDVI